MRTEQPDSLDKALEEAICRASADVAEFETVWARKEAELALAKKTAAQALAEQAGDKYQRHQEWGTSTDERLAKPAAKALNDLYQNANASAATASYRVGELEQKLEILTQLADMLGTESKQLSDEEYARHVTRDQRSNGLTRHGSLIESATVRRNFPDKSELVTVRQTSDNPASAKAREFVTKLGPMSNDTPKDTTPMAAAGHPSRESNISAKPNGRTP